MARKPITEAVRDRLRQDLERAKGVAAVRPLAGDDVERILEIGWHCVALTDVSAMTDDEFPGYDEFGIPSK